MDCIFFLNLNNEDYARLQATILFLCVFLALFKRKCIERVFLNSVVKVSTAVHSQGIKSGS